MKKILLLLWTVLAVLASGADLQTLLTPPAGSFWNRGVADLQKNTGVKFRWGTRDRKSIRYSPKKGTVSALKWLDQPVCEILCTLGSPAGKLQSMTISIYNRGDGGAMNDRDFRRLQERAEDAVSKLAGSNVQPVRDRMRMARETVFSRTWHGPEVRWQLLWCESDRGAEYLTLKALHPSLPEEKLRKAVKAAVDKKMLPAMVKKQEDGSLFMDVPMIDQGEKGYCAAATMARVICYYGGEIDQNQAAQVIGTDAQFGTSWRVMLKKLEQEKSMLNVRMQMLYEFQDFSSFNDIRKFVSRYNRAARSMKKKSIRLEDHIKTSGRTRTLDLNSLNKEIDKEVYRQMRIKDKDYAKFRREVEAAIRQGLPILWEIPGHIRLIVGMDPGKDQIFYSDSWGSGHELKKMPFQEAFILTHRIFVLIPR
ncbi:MAG: C39 family peptidase [Lentisphaeria bacterium]|nr:C39 family peptidase [Lentisphaeria bacterium]